MLLVLVFAAVFVGYLLEEGEFFDAVGWVVAFGDGFFHVFVPVEHVVLLDVYKRQAMKIQFPRTALGMNIDKYIERAKASK